MHKYAVKAAMHPEKLPVAMHPEKLPVAMHPEKLPVAGSVGGRFYTVKYIAHKCMPIKVSI